MLATTAKPGVIRHRQNQARQAYDRAGEALDLAERQMKHPRSVTTSSTAKSVRSGWPLGIAWRGAFQRHGPAGRWRAAASWGCGGGKLYVLKASNAFSRNAKCSPAD